MSSAISKVDSKGRISIPIGLRWKLRLVEGSSVRIVLNKDKLIVTPVSLSRNGQSGVSAARSKGVRVCETQRSGSIPDSDPRKR